MTFLYLAFEPKTGSMKRSATLITLLLAGMIISNVRAQSEFSSPLIGIGIVVSDLDRSMDFYTNVIGMKKTGAFSVDEELARSSGMTGGVPFDVNVMKLEESKDANVWKLMSFNREATCPRSEFIQDDVGMQYVTIMVKSLKPFLDRIRTHGVKLEGETPLKMDGGNGFVLVKDPDGIFIELIGPLE